jgi:DNA-binding transcriptional LysR family regulator
MTLTVRQLEVFLVAAEDCNFHRAAERLGVSQPSVSGRIRSLESYLGYDLFDRPTGSRPRLTVEGRAFIARARQLVSGAAGLAVKRTPVTSQTPLRLKIVIGPLLLTHRVMPELPAFCFENPQIAADFVPLGGTTDGRDLVRRGKADVLVYTGDFTEEEGLDLEVIARTRCSIFGVGQLAQNVGSTAEAVAAAPFILPPEHHTWARFVRSRLAGAGIVPSNIVMRPQFPDLIVQMMLGERGLSVMFDEFVRDPRLRKVGPDLEPASRVIICGPRARQPAAAPLLRFLRSVGAVSDAFRCP